MTYTLYGEDLKEIMMSDYFNNSHDNLKDSTKKKHVSGNFGDFSINESFYSDICLSNCEYSIKNDVKLYSKLQGELFCFSFMNKGDAYFKCGNEYNCFLPQNTCNMFYIAGEINSSLHLKKGINNDALDVIISKNYLVKLANRYPDLLEQIISESDKNKIFKVFNESVFMNPQIQMCTQSIRNTDLLGNTASIYAEAKLLEVFALLLKKEKKQLRHEIPKTVKNKIQEAKYILESRYLSPPCIHELALEIGISDTALKTYFKKMYNKTIFGYLFDFRMEKAFSMLNQNQDLNIAEIAEKTGYEHQSHFCTAFKRKFGTSPKEFRRRHELFI